MCTLECLKYSSLLAISLPAIFWDTLVPTRHIPAPATSLPLCFQPRAPGGVPEGSVPQSCGLFHSRGSRRAPQMPVLAWALQPLHPFQSFCWGSREGAPGYSGWSSEKPREVRARSAPLELATATLRAVGTLRVPGWSKFLILFQKGDGYMYDPRRITLKGNFR